jgi:2'-5' RNA ligase
MYIWIGIDVDGQLCEIKQKALEIDRDFNFENSCFTLPLHISLKMSFPMSGDNFQSVVYDIASYFESTAPFEISLKGIEAYENIVWIRMINNEEINKIHDDLNDMLLSKYGVGLHEYDLDYKFHTTLFMSDDEDKIKTAYEEIKDTSLPDTLKINRFLIGTSNSGKLGTYSVFKEITV